MVKMSCDLKKNSSYKLTNKKKATIVLYPSLFINRESLIISKIFVVREMI